MWKVLLSLVALLSLAHGTTGSALTDEPPVAPDGRRGLGVESELKELLRLFRQPSDADADFLADLRGLEPRIRVLRATAASLYTVRSRFDALDGDPKDGDSLAALHRLFTDFVQNPEPFLVKKDARARVLAELLFDARFRARALVLAGWMEDVDEVRHGLALLSAGADGWVRLHAEEAKRVAGRTDLAAALLRARVIDLDGLRESTDAPAEVAASDVDAFVAVVELPPGPERRAAIDEVLARTLDASERMAGLLFTTRLRATVESSLAWRRDQKAAAAKKRGEVRVWRPKTEAGRNAPDEIARLRKTERRRGALARARQGLFYDPFDDELAYAAASMSLFVAGQYESLDYYDRFLALRGIRVHDGRTWSGDELDADEKEAIAYIQRIEGQAGILPSPGTAGGG